MQEVVRSRPPAPAPPIPPDIGREKALIWVRRLIWTYLVLLILEGALRKWIVPQFSDPLLIVRDPVVIAIYLCAWRGGIFPRNYWVTSLAIIGFLSWLVSLFVLMPYLQPKIIVLVTGYGVRCNYLHLPLIFVMANVFNADDVKEMGWWILAGLIPMALLMGVQFNASPDSFINRTVGSGEGEQITAGGGKIRPPGTFSFVSGAIYYLSCSSAFLLHGIISRQTYRTWLLVASGFALVVAVGVSGSRSTVASVGLVILSLLLILVLRPEAVNKFGRSLLFAVVIGWGISHLPIFRQGLGILSERFIDSAAASETSIAGGMIARTYSGFVEGFRVFDRLPIFGFGLGIGTNVAAKLVTGTAGFLLAEGEWARILLENGPILGLAYLCWRVALTFRLFWLSVRALGWGETLPIMLFSAIFIALLNGQFGQPTTLGFAVFFGGLCLASTKVGSEVPLLASAKLAPPPEPKPKIRGRSAYAARLHQSEGGGPKTNGSTDR